MHIAAAGASSVPHSGTITYSNSIAHSEKQASVVTIRVNVKISYFLYPLNLLQDFFNQYLNNAKIVKRYRTLLFSSTSSILLAVSRQLPNYLNMQIAKS